MCMGECRDKWNQMHDHSQNQQMIMPGHQDPDHLGLVWILVPQYVHTFILLSWVIKNPTCKYFHLAKIPSAKIPPGKNPTNKNPTYINPTSWQKSYLKKISSGQLPKSSTLLDSEIYLVPLSPSPLSPNPITESNLKKISDIFLSAVFASAIFPSEKNS